MFQIPPDLKHSSAAPSDSCSPCAKHFLTATNLIFSGIHDRNQPVHSFYYIIKIFIAFLKRYFLQKSPPVFLQFDILRAALAKSRLCNL